MKLRYLVWLLVMLWGTLALAQARSRLAPGDAAPPSGHPAKQAAVPFFDLKDLRPGMKGVGHTVFQGDTVSDFNVEILGVVENFLPKQNAVFAKLSGGPLAETGVFAGMSGSPVFVEGKLLGAVAYAFPFSKEAIAAITPIQNMVAGSSAAEDVPAPGGTVSPAASRASYDPSQSLQSQLWALVPSFRPRVELEKPGAVGDSFPNPSELKPIDTPLLLSGFSPAAVEYFRPQFRALGLTPVMGGAMGGSDVVDNTLSEAADIEPGSGVGAQLVRGVFGATASGKVTYRDGDRIYAFGHAFLQSGPTELPMTKTRLITVLPSVMSSTELSVPTELIGTIKQDRVSGISGEIGLAPKMIPVTIRLRSSRNEGKVFHFETVNDRFLTPLMVNFTVFSALSSSERTLGESTLELQGTIALKGKQQVKIENFVSGDANASAIASLLVANPVNFLMQSGLKDVQIDSIELDVTSWDEKRQASLERIWADEREVRAGAKMEVHAMLRKTNGEEVETSIPVTIPENVTPGPLQVSVSDGGTLSQIENRETRPTFFPKDVAQLIRTVNHTRQNNRLYVRVSRMEESAALFGETYPAVPPSLQAILSADRTSGVNQTILRTSTLAIFEGAPLNLMLTGQKWLNVTVLK
ncbi:MAG: SpoIVB peptidase S55 domain-containing protein [Acidobacteriia bacterium]|nr:SpoIVB peptidase S55 domain-containing protein [Terriglobia bacterium]